MFERGLLVLQVDIQNESLNEIIENCQQYVTTKLIVRFYSAINIQDSLPRLSHLIQNIYAKSVKLLPNVDVVINLSNLRKNEESSIESSIDVLLLALTKPSTEFKATLNRIHKVSNIINIVESIDVTGHLPNVLEADDSRMYNTTVLGGTFDRVHIGHKILLTEAILRAKTRVVVGVTDESMISSKKLFQLILPVSQRVEDVKKFLISVDDSLTYDVLPISDPFGPTATDPDMDLIVVSEETRRGGEKVNEVRVKNNLNPLIIHVIPLINEFDNFGVKDPLKETKISSSNRRLDLLGTLVQSPLRTKWADRTYVIVIVGVISRDILMKQGAAFVNYLNHEPKEEQVNIFTVDDFDKVDNSLPYNELWFTYTSDKVDQMNAFNKAQVVFDGTLGDESLRKQLNLAWELLLKRIPFIVK